MARGWESKSVESQIEAAGLRKGVHRGVELSPAQAERMRERDGLLLSRTRILHDIEQAQNQRYREILTAALKHLDDKLSKLE